MTRYTTVYRDGKIVTKQEALRMDAMAIAHLRADFPAPAIRSDVIQKPFLSQIDGKTVFDSRSKWERHAKDHGYAIVGDDKPTSSTRVSSAQYEKDLATDLKDAYDIAEQSAEIEPVKKVKPGEFTDVAELAYRAKNFGETDANIRGDKFEFPHPGAAQGESWPVGSKRAKAGRATTAKRTVAAPKTTVKPPKAPSKRGSRKSK